MRARSKSSLTILNWVCLALLAFAPNLSRAEEQSPQSEDLSDSAAAPAASPRPSASPAVAASPAPKHEESASEDESPSEGYGKTHGIAGPVTFGPSLTLLGLTRPFAGGLESKYKDLLGLAFFYGALPEIKISSVKVKYNNWDARVRWYAFRGAFFIGTAVGKQNLTASKGDTISGVPVNATLEMATTFVTPHVGWHWIWKSGFFMGMDLGVQLSMSRSNTVTTDASAAIQAQAQYTTLKNDVTDKAEKLGKIPLPMITFIKVGYLF